VAYAGEGLLWDASLRQQLLGELVQLGAAVEGAFGGVPQVRTRPGLLDRAWLDGMGRQQRHVLPPV
jgi:hypothetical protein